MSLVHDIINDGDTESLIRKYLKAGVMIQGRYERTEKGTPQGGLCGARHNPPYAEINVMMSQSRECA
jgi:hypothetical protein